MTQKGKPLYRRKVRELLTDRESRLILAAAASVGAASVTWAALSVSDGASLASQTWLLAVFGGILTTVLALSTGK
jgi:hypothetical protein